MSILDHILLDKAAEVAAAASAVPLAELRRQAHDVPCPRDFVAALQRGSSDNESAGRSSPR